MVGKGREAGRGRWQGGDEQPGGETRCNAAQQQALHPPPTPAPCCHHHSKFPTLGTHPHLLSRDVKLGTMPPGKAASGC